MSDDLVTLLVADSEPFRRGADEAVQHAHRLEHETGEIAERIADQFKEVGKEIAGFFGIGFGIERFSEGIKDQIEKVTELKHLSERSGIDLNELRALQREAVRSGESVETLQKGITKLQANIGDAAGGGKKRAVFEELGLDPDSLARMDPAQAFAKVGDAIAAVENPTSRVHYAMELLGKGGAESLNVLLAGSKGLREAMEKVGIIDPQDVEELHKAHEAMLDLDAAGQKLQRTFAADLAPAITHIAEALANMIQWIQHLKNEANNPEGLTGQALRKAGQSGLFGPLGLLLPKEADKDKYEKGLFGQDVITSGNKAEIDAYRNREKDRQEHAALESAKREAGLDQKDEDDEEKRLQAIAKRIQAAREKAHPEIAFRREKTELGEAYEGGAISPKEFQEGLADAAKRFHDEMERRDPLKKMKEEAKHLLEGADPARKLKDEIEKVNELYANRVINDAERGQLIDKAEKDFARAKGVTDKPEKDHFTKIEGPQSLENAQAYQAFFKGQQPNVDTNEQKKIELAQKQLDVNREINATLAQINQKTGTTAVASIGP